jgi:hypothetical protein
MYIYIYIYIYIYAHTHIHTGAAPNRCAFKMTALQDIKALFPADVEQGSTLPGAGLRGGLCETVEDAQTYTSAGVPVESLLVVDKVCTFTYVYILCICVCVCVCVVGWCPSREPLGGR